MALCLDQDQARAGGSDRSWCEDERVKREGERVLGDLFPGRHDVSASSRGPCKWRRKWPGGLSRSSQPSSLPEADFGSGSGL